MKEVLDRLDPKFFIALVVILLFAWAFKQNLHDATMKGALITGFAGAWGYYLGSAASAGRAGDRQDKMLALTQQVMSALPSPVAPAPEGTRSVADPTEPKGKDLA